jgi:hypothetical protein
MCFVVTVINNKALRIVSETMDVQITRRRPEWGEFGFLASSLKL